MARKKVAILGATGMLGSMALSTFARDNSFRLIATYRDGKLLKTLKHKYLKVDFRKLDAEKTDLKGISKAIKGAKWVINAIGITKPYVHDCNADEIKRAIYINAIFPHLLAEASKKTNSKIIQIATDCVFSGQKGHYIEGDAHDALDVYGKTKSLGEVYNDNIYHIRCSIIGPELKGHNSLLDWFLGQPKGAKVNGFTNHKWNGITVLHFARICRGIIKKGGHLPHLQHLIPADVVTKANLLKMMAREYNREDIKIRAFKAPTVIDRTLSTRNKKLNREIWRRGGYKTPPTIARMIKELAKS